MGRRDEVEPTSSRDLVPASHSWLPRSLVAAAADPPAPPAILSLFYVGYFHLVTGLSEALKTWMLAAASVRELEAGRGVLWVDGDEVGEGAMLERLLLLGASEEKVDSLFAYVLPDEPLIDDKRDRRPDLLKVVRASSCRFAVLDGFNPLLHLHGLDPDRGVDVEAFYRMLGPIRHEGVAVAISDNVVKSSEARGAWAIGSERKKSKADVHLGMKSLTPLTRGGAGRAKVDVHKDRPGHLTRPTAAVFVVESGTTFSWRIEEDDSHDEGGNFRPTELMLKVSRWLEARIEDPQSRNKIEQAKLGRAEYVRLAINRLVEEGFASESAGPHGAREVRFERPFAEDA